MKKTSFFLFMCSIVLKTSFAQNWSYVGGAIATGVSGAYLRMELTSDGKPIIAFRDGNNNNKLTVKRYNPNNALGNWDSLGTGFTAGSANYISLALAPNNTPYVSYSDGSQSDKISVTKHNGTSWENVGDEGFSSEGVIFNEIAIAPDGTPFVAYCGSTNDKLTVKKYNGSTWETVGTPQFSEGQASYINLRFDANGTPYVAYRDNANDSKLTVMKYNGNAWENVGNPGFSGHMAGYVSLDISSSGTPYVAYTNSDNGSTYDISSGGTITVKKFDGNNWVDVGQPGFSEGAVRYISLALSPTGVPYIAFEDRFTGDYKGTVMKFNGSDWENVENPRFTESALKFSNLHFDASGNLLYGYIAKPTVGPRSVIIRKKNADNGGNMNITNEEKNQFNLYPNPTTDLINITMNTADYITELSIYNSIGQLMINKTIEGKNSTINIESWSNGVYWVVLNRNGIKNTTKLIKK